MNLQGLGIRNFHEKHFSPPMMKIYFHGKGFGMGLWEVLNLFGGLVITSNFPESTTNPFLTTILVDGTVNLQGLGIRKDSACALAGFGLHRIYLLLQTSRSTTNPFLTIIPVDGEHNKSFLNHNPL